MSAQFDFMPDLDVTALTSITQAQLQQLVSQLRPLANIGGVIYGSATPDIANNPRFSRYLWIDSSTIGLTTQATPKYYNTATATWDSVTVPSASVGSAQLAAHVDALTHMFTAATPDATKADRVLVYDSSGQYITQITKASLISSLTVTVDQIPTAGSPNGSIIKNVAGTAAWSSFNFSTDPFSGQLPLANLVAGSNDFLLSVTAGVATYKSNDDTVSDFLPAGTSTVGVNISKLKFLGTALTHPRMNAANSAWEVAADQVLQTIVVNVQGTGVTGATNYPDLTSDPQYNEGDSTTLTTPITPKIATSTLLIDVVVQASHNSAAVRQLVAALYTGTAAAFEAGTPNSLAVGSIAVAQNNLVSITFRYSVTSASTSQRYYGVRFGTVAGTVSLNTDGAGNTCGGKFISTLRIMEVQ